MSKQIFGKAFVDCYRLLNHFRKQGLKIRTPKEMLEVMIPYELTKIREQGKQLTAYDKMAIAGNYEMFAMEMQGNCIHYFIDDEYLRDFLLNTEIKDFSFYKNLGGMCIKYDGAIGYSVTDRMTEEEYQNAKEYENNYFVFCLHFKNETDAPRYMLMFNNKNGFLLGTKFDSSTNDRECDSLPLEDKKHAKEIVKLSENLRIGINFLFYIQAFPEVVRNGIPKGYKTEQMQGKRQTVSLSRKIYVDSERTVTPHFRKGHFRYLGSEWYKEKRGKTIFIDATVVNSKNNKTVGGNDD